MQVGVGLPVGNHRGTPPAPYETIRSLALRAEAIGLDSIWVYDHLLFRMPDLADSGAHEGWSVLAALAEATSRVTLGMLVTGLRLRNPGLLAKMAASVDEVSDGRLVLGVGAGWHDPELEAFGYPTDHRLGRFDEAMQVLVPLLRTGTADFAGQWVTARSAVMLPPARPDIPILIAARGGRMMGLLAKYADWSNVAWFADADDPLLAERSGALDDACREAGRDPASLVRTVGIYVRLPGATAPSPVRGQERMPRITADPTATLRRFSEAGFAHAMVWLDPIDERSLERLGEAVAALRAEGR